MRVRQITSLDGLEAVARDWRELARDKPFLSPGWLLPWWRKLGDRGPHGETQLSVLSVWDDEQLVAIAPWYLERSLWRGRTLQFLGSGAVCSDYLTVPCRPGCEQSAVRAIADWLHVANSRSESRSETAWDVLWLEAIDAADAVVNDLFDALRQRGAIAHALPADDCWRLELPESWDDYLARLSKSHRKRVRRLDRAYFASGRARSVHVESPDEVERGFEILVDLHERRWRGRGTGSIFAREQTLRFHREATRQLFEGGQLQLNWLELDGQAVAAEYSLLGGGILYAYQSGMDPEAAQHEPGSLALMATLRRAIEEGFRAVDFLRGNEPYKQHWRAVPRGTRDMRILRPGLPGQMRRSLWRARSAARHWLRAGRDAVRGASRSMQSKSIRTGIY